MSNKIKKSEKSDKLNVYKKAEFRAFLKSIRTGQWGYWSEIAKAVGVDNDTITKWKKLPEAQEAIKQGIDHSLAEMERVGARDWRMHAEKLKMLGVSGVDKSEVKVQKIDVTERILKEIGLLNDNETKTATPNTPQE